MFLNWSECVCKYTKIKEIWWRWHVISIVTKNKPHTHHKTHFHTTTVYNTRPKHWTFRPLKKSLFWWSFLINSYNLNPSCQSRQPIRTHNLIAHSQIQPYQHSQSNCLKCLKIDFRFFTYPRWRFFPCWWVCFAICILKIISVNICTYMPCKNILVLEFNFIAPIWVSGMLQFFILLHLQLIKLSNVLTFNYRCKGDHKNQTNWTWDWIFLKLVSLAIMNSSAATTCRPHENIKK